MPTGPKIEHLVVDTTAFIKNTHIQDLASNVYTVQGVVDEITNKRQLRNLVVLPYDLKIKDVFPENIKFVTEFSKKTGDYRSLSAVDIQVMALTYQMEKQYVGTEHLRTVPEMQKVDKLTQEFSAAQLAISGFYMPARKNKEQLPGEEKGDTESSEDSDKPNPNPNVEAEEDDEGEIIIIDGGGKPPHTASAAAALHLEATAMHLEGASNVADIKRDPEPEILPQTSPEMQERQLEVEMEETQAMRDLEEALRKTEVADSVAETAAAWSEEEAARATEEEESEDEDEGWDEGGWITPGNVEEAKRDLKAAQVDEGNILVACISGDFAMQNVIKQIGMKIVAPDGRIIKQMRTHILRCYACFKTTSKMELLFCPHCGNRTLHRAAVLLKPDGTEEVQISFRRPPTGRGKRFSIPKPQVGKHAVNPILCPDQRLPHQLASKLARTKNNPLEPDYIAGYSPFIMRDVTSRSAILGIRNSHTYIKNWMRSNPNEVVNKGKKKRK